MQIEAENLDPGILKLNLGGRMDARGTSEIESHFVAHTANQTALIVDLSGVNFLASTGIRMFLMAAKAIHARGGKMALLKPDANVAHILKLTGITVQIPILHSLDDARKAVAA